MKYIKLWGRHISMNKVENFKWEWAVFYERCFQGQWREKKVITGTRYEARVYKESLSIGSKFSNNIRNVQLKRRLVQVVWEDYE